MRPGKPLLFGRLRETPLLGLPGNPVSSLVCALIFLRPILLRLLGSEADEERVTARLAQGLPENDRREDYLRARLERDPTGMLMAIPFPRDRKSTRLNSSHVAISYAV